MSEAETLEGALDEVVEAASGAAEEGEKEGGKAGGKPGGEAAAPEDAQEAASGAGGGGESGPGPPPAAGEDAVPGDEADREVTVGQLVAQLENRGFAPMIALPALVTFLPTGAITTVPSICGVLIFLIAGQMAFRSDHPWLPRFLRELAFSEKRLTRMAETVRPYARRLDLVFRPRLEFLLEPPMVRVVAFLCAISGLSMLPLELIPWACTLPATAILLMAAGLITRDGAPIVAAFLMQVGALGFLIQRAL